MNICSHIWVCTFVCVLRMKIGLAIQIKIVSGAVIYACNHGSQEAKARPFIWVYGFFLGTLVHFRIAWAAEWDLPLKIRVKIVLFCVDIPCKLTSHFLYLKFPS